MKEALDKIHEKKSREDPIYCLLFNPSFIDDNETMPFIDAFTRVCVEYIELKYGDLLLCNVVSKRVLNLIHSDDKTEVYNAKVFTVLFILQTEPELLDQVCNLYTTTDMYNANYFKRIMMRVEVYIDQTLTFPYNKFNMITTINNFVSTVKKDYMMGIG